MTRRVGWVVVALLLVGGAAAPAALRRLSPRLAVRAAAARDHDALERLLTLLATSGSGPVFLPPEREGTLSIGGDEGASGLADPWGRPWVVAPRLASKPGAGTVRSRGPDGQDGGGDDVVLEPTWWCPLGTDRDPAGELLSLARPLLFAAGALLAWFLGAPWARAPRAETLGAELYRAGLLALFPLFVGTAGLIHLAGRPGALTGALVAAPGHEIRLVSPWLAAVGTVALACYLVSLALRLTRPRASGAS